MGLLLLWILPLPAMSADPVKLERLRQRALDGEKRGAWLDAYRCYDDILRNDRHNNAAREGHRRCLRRLHLIARHSDPAYRQTLRKLTPSQALDAYEQVLGLLRVAHPDRARISNAHLFSQGLHELRLALDDPLFRRLYLPGVQPAALAAYKSRLAAWPLDRLSSREAVRQQAKEAIRACVKDGIAYRPLMASALGMEFAAGACYGVDDHSALVPPALAGGASRDKKVGVGLEVGLIGSAIEVTRVYSKGPAEEMLIEEGAHILKVGNQSVDQMTADQVADLLRGDPGSTVEVELRTLDLTDPIKLKLIRRAVAMPSVDYRAQRDEGGLLTGYVRISHFGETTLQEVTEALAALNSDYGEDLKGLILDLRGNPGGLFHSAVAIARLFLSEGVIVISQSAYKDYNRPFKVDAAGPWQRPLVVLIDSETASAAEVLAGALKEARDGRLPTRVVGQTTYGKGSIQTILPVEKVLDRPAGVRLTVARLFSPSNQPYTGRGVAPTHPREQRGYLLLLEAVKELRALIEEQVGKPPMSRPMPMVASMMES